MLTVFKKHLKNRKGFTLVELMAVVVIIGVLVAIAIPVYGNVTKNSNRKAVEANLRTIESAIMMYQADNDTTSIPEQNHLEDVYLKGWPAGPDGVTYDIVGGKAVASKDETNTGDWFTDDEQSLPVEWD